MKSIELMMCVSNFSMRSFWVRKRERSYVGELWR